MRHGLVWSVLILLVALTGCRKADPWPPRASASATVLYQGKPVEGATVTLAPEAKDGSAAFGRTSANGKAKLGTFAAEDGVLPGSYQVTITKTVVEAGAVNKRDGVEDVVTKDLLPKKYGNIATSDLKAEVSASGKNDLTFELSDGKR